MGMERSSVVNILREVTTALRAYLDHIDKEGRHPSPGEAEILETVLGHVASRRQGEATRWFYRLGEPHFHKCVVSGAVTKTTTSELRLKLDKLGY
jgi:hypothetical protein